MIVRPLTEYCTLNMGQSPDSKTYNTQGKGLPFYQGNADFGETHPITRVWCSAPVKIAEDGDILISVRAPIGAMNMAVERCCIGRGLAALTPFRNKCSKQFLYYALQSKVDSLIAQGTGSTFKAISKKVLEATCIPAYSTIEQEQIAETIGRVDNAIAARRNQLLLLNQLVKSRFIELFGDLVIGNKVGTNKKRIGEIASVTKLAGFEFTKYIQYKEHGDIIMLRGLNCKKGHLILDDIKWIDKETSDLLPRSKLHYGDILMTYAGTIGDVAMVDANDKYHLAPNVAKITVNDMNAYNPVFLMHLFMYTNDYIMTFASVVAQASINMEKIRGFEYYFPPIEKQNQFAAFVEQTDKSKLAVQKGLQKLEILKKSLMQQYFG